MSEQQHLDLDVPEPDDDPAERIVEQYLATFNDRSQVLVTTYGDGSLTMAKRRHRAERWGVPVRAHVAP